MTTALAALAEGIGGALVIFGMAIAVVSLVAPMTPAEVFREVAEIVTGRRRGD